MGWRKRTRRGSKVRVKKRLRFFFSLSLSLSRENLNSVALPPASPKNSPALFTRMSIDSPPKASRAARTHLGANSASVTSPANAAAFPGPPEALISAATPLAFSPSRSATRTRAPCEAKRRAAAAPRPWPAPVMMATLIDFFFFFERERTEVGVEEVEVSKRREIDRNVFPSRSFFLLSSTHSPSTPRAVIRPRRQNITHFLTCPSRRRSARKAGREAETAEGEMIVDGGGGGSSAIGVAECCCSVVVVSPPAVSPAPPPPRWRLTAARRRAAAEESIVEMGGREVERGVLLLLRSERRS